MLNHKKYRINEEFDKEDMLHLLKRDKDIEKRIGKGAFAAQIASNNAIKLILESKVVE